MKAKCKGGSMTWYPQEHLPELMSG